METKLIGFNMSKKYLSHWGIKEAMREIFQNFIDYGEYEIEEKEEGEFTKVSLINDYNPEDLSFLVVGESHKTTDTAIGKYGEGLKMAMMVFARENRDIAIRCDLGIILGEFHDNGLGIETFHLRHNSTTSFIGRFKVSFIVKTKAWKDFIDNKIIKEGDVLEKGGEYGDVVNKNAGDIYVGGLYVCTLPGFNKAYNLNPKYVILDRDRSVPRNFDVEWAAGKINSAIKNMSAEDLLFMDSKFIDKVPEVLLPSIKARNVNNTVKFFIKVEDEETKTINEHLIPHDHLQKQLQQSNFFQKAVAGIKRFIFKQMGVYEAFEKFRDKHIHDTNAREEFNLILERLK